MIKVEISDAGKPISSIKIEELSENPDGTADYSIRIAADRGFGVGIHQRGIHKFPKNKYNVLALLRQALQTLEEEELGFDGKTLS